MLAYIGRRVLIMIPTLILISIVTFAILQLPPGDYLTSYAAQLRTMGEQVDDEALQSLRDRYGLGQPVYVQYGKWVAASSRAATGASRWSGSRPVSELIWETLGLTVALAVFSMLISWLHRDPDGRLLGHAPVFDAAIISCLSSASSAWACLPSCGR